jgi:heme-degrading monooxygenase HmoA
MKNLDNAKWVVLFISKKRDHSTEYLESLNKMIEKVKKIPGFVHIQSFENNLNQNITVSYWKNRASINEWGRDNDHIEAQKRGIVSWYSKYQILTCKIQDYYDFRV